MLPSFLQLGAENEVRDAFRAIGAVTPATARPRKDMTLDNASFDDLLRRGVIREGAPETFYLYQPPPERTLWAVRVIVWMALILTPVALIQYCPRSP